MIIDRIPFPRPDDPLMSARQRAADQAGGNGFMQVAATHAALLLAQGSGRLIRTTADKGVVAVLDPRLATARYGSFLKASLPPMWTTTDPAVVRKALARLAGVNVEQRRACSSALRNRSTSSRSASSYIPGCRRCVPARRPMLMSVVERYVGSIRSISSHRTCAAGARCRRWSPRPADGGRTSRRA